MKCEQRRAIKKMTTFQRLLILRLMTGFFMQISMHRYVSDLPDKVDSISSHLPLYPYIGYIDFHQSMQS